jgi:hypothetical protein
MDVVTILMDEGKVVWYENLRGWGIFGPQQIILDDPGTAWSVATGDINGDGYEDVITNTDSYTVWCENDGQGNFTIHDVFPEDFSEGFYVEDIDGDGDMDVVSAEIIQREVGWFENIDGDGLNFAWKLIQDNAQGVRAVHATDINNDGLMDIISGWWGADVVAWHENMGLGIDDNSLSGFSVYPIPTIGILNVQSKTTIIQIELYNLLGQLVKSNTNQISIDISSVDQGIYFVKVMDENGNIGTQKVVKK